MRESGILLHISSLPSNYGIGTFGKKAFEFVDFLEKTGQTYWQILPLGTTSYGDSPYQTFSINAINPYFIDLDFLVSEGMIKDTDLRHLTNSEKVDYEKLYNERYVVLKKAANNFDYNNSDYQSFLNDEKKWVYDYAFFMALKRHYGDGSWAGWPNEVRTRDNTKLSDLYHELEKEISFHLFMQFQAYKQFFALRRYANNRGIKIIGDIPIYVSYDSSDVWVNPHLFQLDEKRNMVNVAGVPPDGFTPLGQLWGNPLYNWQEHENNGFQWWVNRIAKQKELFDMIRIDHFIGFENYYSIPANELNAVNGTWKKGPGMKLFRAVKNQLGELNIIAEDLGVVTDDVRKLLKETGFPGMNLMQFAFNANEVSDFIPYGVIENSATYTGTHDSETSREWFENINKRDLEYCLDYINCQIPGTEVDSLIKAAMSTKSRIVIVPMQDYLNIGKAGRMNVPATLGGNWVWRMSEDYCSDDLVNKIARWVKTYGRKRK